jgi:predicted transcriptional regulator
VTAPEVRFPDDALLHILDTLGVYASIRHMKRTTLFLYETLECDLKALARQQGRPVADMVREAISDYVAREKEKARRPLRFVAIGRSGHSDTAERHEELLFAGPEPPRGARPRTRSKAVAAGASRRR